jgi:hypothetical protein
MHDLCLDNFSLINKGLIDDNEAAFKATGVILLRQEEIQADPFSLSIPGPTVTQVNDRSARVFAPARFFTFMATT